MVATVIVIRIMMFVMSLPDFVHIYCVFLSTLSFCLNHCLKYKYYMVSEVVAKRQ